MLLKGAEKDAQQASEVADQLLGYLEAVDWQSARPDVDSALNSVLKSETDWPAEHGQPCNHRLHGTRVDGVVFEGRRQ